jgi:hypothetical protein
MQLKYSQVNPKTPQLVAHMKQQRLNKRIKSAVNYIMLLSYKVGTMISVAHIIYCHSPRCLHGVYRDTFTLPLIQSNSPLQNANNRISIFSTHTGIILTYRMMPFSVTSIDTDVMGNIMQKQNRITAT